MARVSVGSYSPPTGYDVGDLARKKYVDVVRQKAGLWPADRLLDVECGSGAVSNALARAFTRARIVGVDEHAEAVAAAALNGARERIPPERLAIVRARPEALPFPDEFFLVSTCALALHRVKDPLAVLAEMHRVTEYGGKCLLVDVDLTRASGVPEGFRRNVLDEPLFEAMKTMGWGKVVPQRISLLRDGGVLRLVGAKRFDPEETMDAGDDEEE